MFCCDNRASAFSLGADSHQSSCFVDWWEAVDFANAKPHPDENPPAATTDILLDEDSVLSTGVTMVSTGVKTPPRTPRRPPRPPASPGAQDNMDMSSPPDRRNEGQGMVQYAKNESWIQNPGRTRLQPCDLDSSGSYCGSRKREQDAMVMEVPLPTLGL